MRQLHLVKDGVKLRQKRDISEWETNCLVYLLPAGKRCRGNCVAYAQFHQDTLNFVRPDPDTAGPGTAAKAKKRILAVLIPDGSGM